MLPLSVSHLIGIDITSTAVRLIELAMGHSTYTIAGLAVEPLPPGAMAGRLIQQPSAVVTALSQALTVLAPGTRRAALSLPSSAVTTSRVSLPACLDDADISARLEWESDRHFVVPFTELAVDFQRLHQTDADTTYQDIEVVACHESRMSQRVALMQDVDLDPVVVDVEHMALQRALQFLVGDAEGLVLVDLHADLIAVHIWQRGRWRCSRDFPRPGASASHECRQLADRVAACIALCGAFCPGRLPDRLLVSGELPDADPCFLDRLAAGVSREVGVVDPLAALGGASRQDSPCSPCWLSASGLAMWRRR